MRAIAWISAALVALVPFSALALDASRLPPARGGPTTLDKLTIVQPDSAGPIGGMCATAPGGTVCRPLSDRAADVLNVKDKGAKLDGSTDTTAFQAARAAAPAFGIIQVPPGCINASVPTDSTKTVLWQLSGNTYCGGTAPVAGIGSDIVETFLPNNGGKFFGQTATTTASKPLTTFQRTVTHTGGGGGVLDTVRVNTTVIGLPGAYIFGLTSVLDDNSTGANNAGNYVAGYFQYNRRSGAVGGWSYAAETNDFTNTLSSQSAPLLGGETLLKTNRADDAAGGRRFVEDLVLGKALNDGGGITYEQAGITAFSRASNFGGDINQGSARFGYYVTAAITGAAFNAADTKYVGPLPIALRTGNGAYVDFSSDGTKLLRWQPGAGLQYTVLGNALLTLPDAGGIVMPDAPAPTSSSDPTGVAGETRFNGSVMYHKTTSGWVRFTGSTF